MKEKTHQRRGSPKAAESKQSPARALVLFSGGLDSILAVKILESQGIDVTALTFVSYFWSAEQAKKSAKKNKIKLITKDFSHKHFEIIKKPKYGRGAGMNPCIDCHFLMLKVAKKIAREAKYEILATGEVLGQRPMSQNSRALELIEKKAGLVGKILRPLSAKALPETEMEKSKIVNREKLLGISGRSRKEQLELAKKYKIKYFPSPAGGCILTDKEYSKKLRELLEKNKKPKPSDLKLLRLGRHFWSDNTRIILGRNHEENLMLKKLAEKGLPAGEEGDTLIEPKDIPGPTVLIRGKKNKAVLDNARDLLLKYTKNAPEDLQIKITAGK
ncbi:MAG: tRNA 4-thiouridine(8) synthase ThiI [Candidatus Moranbacteria bacterium]|nr:tRNA 4-thiouridine(8) synthase ThiI [Candidatus Moranbacteria bacterium]